MFRLTASAAKRTARTAAAGLQRANLTPGDRVAIATQGEGLAWEEAAAVQASVIGLVLGALHSGIVPVMINPQLPREIRHAQVRNAQVRATVDSPASLAALLESGAGLVGPDLAVAPLGRPMYYTSGTTGHSKGVWSGTVDEASSARWWADEQQQWALSADDTTLVHGPLTHSGPLRFSLLTLLAGGTVLLPGTFDLSRIAKSRSCMRWRRTWP